jgi:hypothetical protein
MRQFFAAVWNWIKVREINRKNVSISLFLDIKTYNRLKSLQDQSGSKDFASMTQEAFRLYEYYVLEARLGTKFYKKDEDTGKFEQVQIFKDTENEEEDDEEEDND